MRQTELVSASRVAILEQLSASIGEINQPICALVLNAEAALQLLRAQPTNTGAVRRLLACIVKDGLRTGDIVRRTRALTEKAPPVSETQCPVNVDTVENVWAAPSARGFVDTGG
jgi:C4-dicarboxylate-specific signal transduction histidine kinase